MTKARNIADIGSNDVLDTDANGVDVTGSITADGLTVDGTATITNTASTNTLTLTGNTGSVAGLRLAAEENHAVILGVNEGNNFGGLKVQTNSNGTLVDRFNVASNGDITMYKDDGTTTGTYFDASSGNLGVGDNTSLNLGSSGFGVHIKSPATKDALIKLDSSDSNTSGWVQFSENGTDQWRVAYDPSNNHLEFTESGVADRMVIKDSTGFVGVGLSEPRQLLHVNQTTASSDSIIRITNTNTPSTGSHRVEFADGIGTTEGSNVFRYGYIAGERSGGSNNGHIIIGTKPDNSTSPREHLRVTSSGELIITGTYNGNARDDAYLVFDIKNSNGDSKKAQIHAIKTADISSELIFSTTASHTFDERMRIADNGNIGVGTGATPSTNNGNVTKLIELQSTNNNCITGTTDTGGMSGLLIEARHSGRSPQPRYAQIGMACDSSGNGNIGFYTAASNGYVLESMMIDDNGRVTKVRQPVFEVSTVPNSHPVGSVVDFTATHTNTGNCWDNTNNRFVAPVNGMYQFNFSVFTHRTTGTGDFYWDLRKNGSTVLRAYDTKNGTANGHCQIIASHALYLTANQYVDLLFVISPGNVGMEASGNHNRFSGFLIA